MIVFTGTNMYVGSLVGTRTNYFTGPGNHWQIGPILNSTNGSSVALTKSGAGTLTLEAINTYGFGTTLAGGTLIVNGSLPAGTFNISSGTTLGGSGTINPAVTLPSGATLTPGNYALGTLTVNNALTLLPGSTCRFELDKTFGATNDQLLVTGALALGGTLTVTNLGGTLWAGDSFQLFTAASPSGAFAATNLPPLPVGFLWQWTPANGTLSIYSTVALDPANINASLAGNACSLSWPSDHTGWRLQAQTNAVGAGLGTNWADVPGSTTTNSMNLPVDPANGSVFYRLVFP
jgi:autotransporter-associated beta strand protein